MFVTNANSDRRKNAGTLVGLDLEAFHCAAQVLPGWGEGAPRCKDAGGEPDDCRKVPNLPQVTECTEERYVASDATVQVGNFTGPTVAWDQVPGNDRAMLLVPVRGDPSITWVRLSGGLDGDDVHFECGQHNDPDGQRHCDEAHRMSNVRNDPDTGGRLSREPFRILVTTEPGRPLAYVTHQGDADLTLIALDGLFGNPDEIQEDADDPPPAIVQQANALSQAASAALQGGFGIAQRPCDVATNNAPSSTLDCTRPLVYAAMRWRPEVRTITAINQDLPLCAPGMHDDYDPNLVLTYCEAQAKVLRLIGSIGQLSLANVQVQPSRPVLADIGFSRTGNELYIVQSNPGALLRLDTSIGVNGETLDVPAGQVEICSQPTTFVIYDDGGSQFGIVTCYRSGDVFIVDLASLTVVGAARAGIGPDAMAVDLAREVLYVANSLDATISVIDMSPARSARFTQIARIGLQEPYKQ
jgi:hypothetical protein